MILIAIVFNTAEEERGGRANSPEKFQSHAFPSQGDSCFDIERTLQKLNICSFAEKGMGLDSQDPLVASLRPCLYSGLVTTSLRMNSLRY